MSIFVISCAMRDMTHDYAPLWDALAKAGAQRAMEAVWLIETDRKVEEVTVEVLGFLTPEDRLLVAQIGRWSATRLIDDAGAWLKTRMP